MEAKDYYKYASWCHKQGIKIYPQPAEYTKALRIIIERPEKTTIGEKLFYNERPNKNENSVYEQIQLLYKLIYEKENLEIIKQENNGIIN